MSHRKVKKKNSFRFFFLYCHFVCVDYSKGFGGKFGVQEDRKDKSAVGWDYVEAPQKHESQLDHKVVSSLYLFYFIFVYILYFFTQGFGGKFGVQNDRMDKSAIGFESNPEKIGTNYTKTKPDIGTSSHRLEFKGINGKSSV